MVSDRPALDALKGILIAHIGRGYIYFFSRRHSLWFNALYNDRCFWAEAPRSRAAPGGQAVQERLPLPGLRAVRSVARIISPAADCA